MHMMDPAILPPHTERFSPKQSPYCCYEPAPVETLTSYYYPTAFGGYGNSLTQPANPVNDISSSIPTQPAIEPLTPRDNEKLNKPTCSLSLLCYRSGRQGCVRRQIQVYSQAKYAALSGGASIFTRLSREMKVSFVPMSTSSSPCERSMSTTYAVSGDGGSP